MEKWKNILELDSQYQISNYGRVKRLKRKVKTVCGKNGFREIYERISVLQDNGKGYQQLYVSINKKRVMLYVHRLVATYFLKNPMCHPEVNHEDGDKRNNRLGNLKWVTKLENMEHAIKNNLLRKGETHVFSKLNENIVLAIRRLHRMNPGFNKSKIAKKLGVRDTTIHKIINFQRWKHLKQIA